MTPGIAHAGPNRLLSTGGGPLFGIVPSPTVATSCTTSGVARVTVMPMALHAALLCVHVNVALLPPVAGRYAASMPLAHVRPPEFVSVNVPVPVPANPLTVPHGMHMAAASCPGPTGTVMAALVLFPLAPTAATLALPRTSCIQ